MSFTINPFFLVASIILFLVGFEVWGDLESVNRAIVFALAFWQLGLAVSGIGFPVGNRRG